MKTPHESPTTVITTPQQKRIIERLMDDHLQEGGAILAQVFHDGLRLKVLTPAQADELAPALQKAMGKPVRAHIVHSAFDTQGEAP